MRHPCLRRSPFQALSLAPCHAASALPTLVLEAAESCGGEDRVAAERGASRSTSATIEPSGQHRDLERPAGVRRLGPLAASVAH